VTPSRRQDARNRESLASEPVPVPETHPRNAPGSPAESEVPPFETERRTPPNIPPPSLPGDRPPPDQQYDDAKQEERQRIFMENEQRNKEARDETWQDLERRSPQVVHAVSGDAQPVAGSVRSASDVAPADINEALRAQREEPGCERELEQAERERLVANAEAERALRIQAFEGELAAVKAELENERQLRATEEADAKKRELQETRERDEGIRNQLEKMDQRWEESQARQEAQDARCQEMFDMVARIVEDREADRVRTEEERIANEGRPGRFPVCAFNE
jgi:hypothetical protein